MEKIQRFTFKGSLLIVTGITVCNVLIITLFKMIGLTDMLATTLVNTFLSPLVLSYVTVYVDGNGEKQTFIKRYILFGLLFGATSILWGMGIYV